jgi:hypothetical protein
LILFRFGYQAFTFWWEKTHPAPPPPPTVSFGKLPKISFPANSSGNIILNLELPTQEFPAFSDRAKVFVMPYKKTSFLAYDQAKAIAAGYGFANEPEAINTDIYKWTNPSPITSSLRLNIIDGSFEYVYNWQEDQTILQEKNIPGQVQAINDTKDFVSRSTGSSTDLLNAQGKVNYFKVSGTRLLPAMSLAEAQFTQVDLYRASIDTLPVATQIPDQGIISALLSGSQGKQFLKVNNNYFPVNYEQYATYPIKTASQAWEDLKNGKGYIAKLPENQTNITVRRIYIGFYETYEPQSYLQPVFIFTDNEDFFGSNKFVAYVPAIIDLWY